MWKQWLQQAEGLVMLPDAEREPSHAWTLQQRATSHRACLTERRIHSSVVKRQHMFTVSHCPGETLQRSALPRKHASGLFCRSQMLKSARQLSA